jgi:hypothetical protein
MYSPPNSSTVVPLTAHMVCSRLALGHRSDAPDADAVNCVQVADANRSKVHSSFE